MHTQSETTIRPESAASTGETAPVQQNSGAPAAGSAATVVAMNTAAFALGFAAWVIFGPSIRFIAKELSIPLATATLIKTLPILTGSVLRIPVGILADRVGARALFPVLIWITAAALVGLSFAGTATALMAGGLVLGLVGTTFAVGVQSVSSWTAKNRQGFALGIFGAGNVGTAITTFGLPLLLTSMGWRGAFRVYAVGLALGGVAYWLIVRNAPRRGPALTLSGLIAPVRSGKTWQLGLYYMASFGTFVAATLSLTDIYIDAFRVSVQTAGMLATTFTFTASLARIPGGYLADRFGARGPLRLALVVSGLSLLPICLGWTPGITLTVALAFVSALAMGVGMAATFKYIPQFFPNTVGAVGGVVGALGGLGGFFLPQAGAAVKSMMGSTYAQLLPLAGLALAAAALHELATRNAATAAGGELQALQQALGTSVMDGQPAGDGVKQPAARP